MSSVKNLVIFASNYPYGEGEPFLEAELKVLADKFETIYIINSIDSSDKKEIYFVPKNVRLLSITPQKKESKLTDILSFKPVFEVLLAVIKHKLKPKFALFHLIYGYWFESKRYESKIKQFIVENKIDFKKTCFYTYWCDITAVTLANMHQKNKAIQFVTRLHGWDIYYERHSTKFLPFRSHIFNQAQYVAPISNDGRKYIFDRKLSIRREKVIASHLGVKKSERNILYRGTDNNDVFHIVTLSHINPVKSLHRLSDALCKIDNYKIKWTHIGYGDGTYDVNYKATLEKTLALKSTIDYEFIGQLPKKEVLDYLVENPIDVIVNCSTTEGIPVSLMEAMAAGIPAIAINVGGVPEIVQENVNGFLLENTEEDIVEKLKISIIKFIELSFEDKKHFSDASFDIWEREFNDVLNYSNFSKLLKNEKELISTKIHCQQCLIDSEIYPTIVLDKYGSCDICSIISTKNQKLLLKKESGYINELLEDIHTKKGSKEYDCILGISGGIDSSFLAIKAMEWGLNPLLVHVDTGWNSEQAVDNIKLLLDYTGFDLYTVVIDWNEIQDIVRSFMRASVIDIDWANELSAQASLYKVATKFGVKHILTGHQIATEGWMPLNIVHYKLDLINFKAIHKRFGEIKLKTYPTIGVIKTYYYEKIKKINFYNPLDFIPYKKEDVKVQLINLYGYRDHGQKHFENIFTRFYQGYILPYKFKVDKRIFHFSSLIVDGQLLKEEAQKALTKNPYNDPYQYAIDKEFVIKKLGFTDEEFENILTSAPKNHTDYPSYLNVTNKVRRILQIMRNTR